jgi:hypothetical protein
MWSTPQRKLDELGKEYHIVSADRQQQQPGAPPTTPTPGTTHDGSSGSSCTILSFYCWVASLNSGTRRHRSITATAYASSLFTPVLQVLLDSEGIDAYDQVGFAADTGGGVHSCRHSQQTHQHPDLT